MPIRKICGTRVAYCECIAPAGHDERSEPHRCRCGGAWRGRDNTFVVLALPTRFIRDNEEHTP